MKRIRIWKLGNAEKNMYPTTESLNRFLEILKLGLNAESVDIIWDCNLEVLTIEDCDDGTSSTTNLIIKDSEELNQILTEFRKDKERPA